MADRKQSGAYAKKLLVSLLKHLNLSLVLLTPIMSTSDGFFTGLVIRGQCYKTF
jgi:hypothetical protein